MKSIHTIYLDIEKEEKHIRDMLEKHPEWNNTLVDYIQRGILPEIKKNVIDLLEYLDNITSTIKDMKF
jgi:hypothetical protein